MEIDKKFGPKACAGTHCSRRPSRRYAACAGAGVSRQVAHGYLQGLVREGWSRPREPRALASIDSSLEVARGYPREGLQEDLVWRELISPVVARLAQNVRDIWHYAATEMINNAIDHSGSHHVEVRVSRTHFRPKYW